MKKIIFCLLCLVNSMVVAANDDLIWATGGDYYNKCSNINNRHRNVQVVCYSVSTVAFSQSLFVIPYITGMDSDKYSTHYNLNKLSAHTAYLQLMTYLQNNPDKRTYDIGSISSLSILENYPPLDSLKKEEKTDSVIQKWEKKLVST